jgi:hypothetical protein
MRPRDNPPSTREKIESVLNVLSSEEACLDPNARFTKAEMVKWCRTWIEIYDQLPQHTSMPPASLPTAATKLWPVRCVDVFDDVDPALIECRV